MFKSVKIPTLELMEGDIPNAYTHCMCACALIYPWTKTSVKNTGLPGWQGIGQSALLHWPWVMAVISLLAKPPFLDINLSHLI